MAALVDTEYTFNCGKKAGINSLETRVGAGRCVSGCMRGIPAWVRHCELSRLSAVAAPLD